MPEKVRENLNQNQKMILNGYQRDFPLVSRPFAKIGENLGLSENEILAEMTELQNKNIIARIGAAVRPNRAGASTLAALAVPPERLEEMANLVSAEVEVNHNYEREHHFNLWFVITASDISALASVIARLEEKTGLDILELPLEKPYHIDLGFAL